MNASNFQYVKLVIGATTYQLNTMGAGGTSRIQKAQITGDQNVAEYFESSNTITAPPLGSAVINSRTLKLMLTLTQDPAAGSTDELVRAMAGASIAVSFRRTVEAIATTNPEVQFNGYSNKWLDIGGSVASGAPTVDVEITVNDGVVTIDTTP